MSNSTKVGNLEFLVGEEYIRKEIHDALGGQRQGGISTPANYPIVLIFTGESGKQHGYGFDGWSDRETFLYTGEGQPDKGDMRFKGGNLAIRDHVKRNEQLLLFEQVRRQGSTVRRVKFVGEMRYRNHRVVPQDSEGFRRDVIVFELSPVDS